MPSQFELLRIQLILMLHTLKPFFLTGVMLYEENIGLFGLRKESQQLPQKTFFQAYEVLASFMPL